MAEVNLIFLKPEPKLQAILSLGISLHRIIPTIMPHSLHFYIHFLSLFSSDYHGHVQRTRRYLHPPQQIIDLFYITMVFRHYTPDAYARER